MTEQDKEVQKVLGTEAIFAVKVRRKSKEIWRMVTVPFFWGYTLDRDVQLQVAKRWPNSKIVSLPEFMGYVYSH